MLEQENGKLTIPDRMITKSLCYCVESAEGKKKREEQMRTTIKKKLFLEAWAKSRGIISACCGQIDISRDTFYVWRDTDPDFRAALEIVSNRLVDDLEDVAKGLALIEKDGPMVKFMLQNLSPKYKPRMVQEIVVGERTLEDLLDEDDKKYEDKQGTDRGAVENPEQKGADSSVQIEHPTTLLLGEKDGAQSDSQATTKRIK